MQTSSLRQTVFVIFWLKDGQPHCKMLDALDDVLKQSECLRKQEGVSFVCSVSEDPDRVGKLGVQQADSTYSWFKRRRDPSLPIGRKNL